MYNISFTKTAYKQFKKLEKQTQKRIYHALERVRIRPEKFLETLVESKYFKLRVGQYRVIVDLKQKKFVVLVVEVGHRRNVYNKPH